MRMGDIGKRNTERRMKGRRKSKKRRRGGGKENLIKNEN